MIFWKARWLPIFLALLFQLGVPADADAYALSGHKWPDGTQILMHLGLDRAQIPLQDGSATWNDSAADALAIWNQYIPKVMFVTAGEVAPANGDLVNTAFFAYDVYGQAFGANVLAITLRHWNGASDLTETDVVFNNQRNWDSYRGPLQGSGPNGLYDFHRVALHEFGHVLGLDHPDDVGQSVVAIMNSIISDLDQLADDDIAGASVLYGYKITSPLYPQYAISGNTFTYKITSEGNPTSFKASGLPPELQFDPSTGVISGHCRTLGQFQITIVAETTRGAATGSFTLAVTPAPITSNLNPSVLIGDSFFYQITASNNPTGFTATGLPAGLTFDPGTGVISGTPTVTGTFLVTVTAAGANAIAGNTIQIQVLPPQITSSLASVTLNLGDSFSYQIKSTHNPTSFDATGLPPGFQVDPATGIITGMATTGGLSFIIVKAHTSYGDASGSLPVNILPPHLTNTTNGLGNVGQPFNFQITASNNPTSFAADTLPVGLQLNPNTGQITGTPTLSGSYSIHVTIHTSYGDGTGYVYIFINSVPNYSTPLATFSFTAVGPILVDPSRPRVYVARSNGISVVDTNSNAIVQHFEGYNVSGLAISPDNNTLYFTTSSYGLIFTIDLNTLMSLSISTPSHAPTSVAAGADGYLYLTDAHANGLVFQIDPATGADRGSFTAITRTTYTPVMIKTTPDHKTLLVGELNRVSPTVSEFALSAGAVPTRVQELDAITPGLLTDIAITADESGVAFITSNASAQPAPFQIRSLNDLNVSIGTIPAPSRQADLAFSPDGVYAVQTYQSSTRVDTIRIATGKIEQSITASSSGITFGQSNVAIDGSSSRILIATTAGTVVEYPLHGPAVPAKSLMNVSTRLNTETGDNVAIGGFIIAGTAPKTVLVRGMGPTLKSFGLSGTLADPTLELHASDGSIITSNDNWNEHRQDVLNTNQWPGDEHEAAIVATLNPGNYTAILRGVNSTTGIALVEVYDVDPASASRVTNISTRGRVETGDNVMIGGFIVGGDQPTKVIVRAIGPSLTQYGVTGVLADPALDLYDANGNKFATNDSWSSDQQQQIIDSGYAPGDPREAAIVSTLQPGAYTAIVTGANNTTGVALVEIYNLENAP